MMFKGLWEKGETEIYKRRWGLKVKVSYVGDKTKEKVKHPVNGFLGF